jgi:hypothetical protein
MKDNEVWERHFMGPGEQEVEEGMLETMQMNDALDASTFEAQVLTLPSFVYSARLREAAAQRELDLAQIQTKLLEAWAGYFANKAVAEAYRDGLVDGKNAEERKVQTSQVVLDSQDYLSAKANAESLSERIPGLQHTLDIAKAHRRFLEERQAALSCILRWREMEARK